LNSDLNAPLNQSLSYIWDTYAMRPFFGQQLEVSMRSQSDRHLETFSFCLPLRHFGLENELKATRF
jgi:hypothetical protein